MGVEPRHGDARRFDAERAAAGVRDADHFEHARLLYPVARLSQRYVRGDVDDAEVLVREHHGVFIGVRVVRINFGVAREVVPGHIDGFLAQGVRDGRVHLTGERQLNDALYIPERRLAAERRRAEAEGLGRVRLAGDILRLHDAEAQHVDCTEQEVRFLYALHRVDADRCAGQLIVYRRSVFHRSGVADDEGTAAVIDRFVRERAYRDLRAVTEGIAHRNAEDRAFHRVFLLLLFSTYQQQRKFLMPFSFALFLHRTAYRTVYGSCLQDSQVLSLPF